MGLGRREGRHSQHLDLNLNRLKSGSRKTQFLNTYRLSSYLLPPSAAKTELFPRTVTRCFSPIGAAAYRGKLLQFLVTNSSPWQAALNEPTAHRGKLLSTISSSPWQAALNKPTAHPGKLLSIN